MFRIPTELQLDRVLAKASKSLRVQSAADRHAAIREFITAHAPSLLGAYDADVAAARKSVAAAEKQRRDEIVEMRRETAWRFEAAGPIPACRAIA